MDKQKEYINHADGINDYTCNKAKDAISFLEQEFGKNFFKTHSVKHPLIQKILNKATWQIKELIEFVETLKALKISDSNYEKLIEKLRNEKDAKNEGIPFVDISRMYHKENMNITFLKESKEQGHKTPDIQAINIDNRDTLYLEITTLNTSDDNKKIQKNYHFFFHEFNYNQPFLPFFGKQKKLIEEKEYHEIKNIISNIKNRVNKNNQIIYYSDSRFSFLFSPSDKTKDLIEICRKNDIKPLNFEGIYLKNDAGRVNNKIKKAKQIPKGSNGLLYVSVNPYFFVNINLSNLIIRLEANIAKHTNLLGIVLFTKFVDSREKTTYKVDNHLFSRKTIQSLCYESLFIYNKNCKLILSDETVQKIYKTFT